ncbi:MAG: hypothetical protein IJQ73_03455 [Kiritimatiellae bacterium]|nr:hypothetical protein [Kiritimatiellia bacterium]
MKRLRQYAAPALAALVFAAGCTTPVLKLTMVESGEFKLSDISKIAILDFNSLPGDPFGNSVAADAETCGIMQRAVSAALSRSHTWEITRLDVEQAVAAFDPAILPKHRFDAIAYGRVWWQYPPERDLMKPALFTLETKTRVTYQVEVPVETAAAVNSIKELGASLSSLKNAFKGLGGVSQPAPQQATATAPATRQVKLVERQVDLTTKTEDVLERVGHRSREAILMLALSIYRVRYDGRLEKLVDMFVADGQTYGLSNGDFESNLSSFGGGEGGKKAAAQEEQKGATAIPAHLTTIPPDMQAKLMLAVRAAEEIGRQIAPHKVVRIIPYSFSDAKLQKLLQNRAYMAAEQYALRSIRTALGAEVAAKVEPLMSYGKPKYEVKSSPAADMEAVSGDEKSAAAAAEKLAAKRGCAEALFALGICQEAGGRAEEALYTYRYVFRLDASPAAAEGIARCHEALGDAARIAEQSRSKKKAERKTQTN